MPCSTLLCVRHDENALGLDAMRKRSHDMASFMVGGGDDGCASYRIAYICLTASAGIRFARSHARSAAVLWNELDTPTLKSAVQSGQRRGI
jgi:hypothetical protein